MYLDTLVNTPDVRGKITYRTKGETTYVEYEVGRVYDRNRKFTTVSRKTIGKVSSEEGKMQPNENFLKYFPEVELPEERNRTLRSCSLRIGSWSVIRKIVYEYRLIERLEAYLPAEDVGLFLDLAAYSIIEEDNRAQHYPAYAYGHPLFSRGMRIYSDSKISEFLRSMDEESAVGFQNAWNEGRDHREKVWFSYDSTNKKCQAGDLRIVETGHSKTNEETEIFNYAVAFDTKNREPLFYEVYPGSINDMSQLRCMVDKAVGYGYKKIGFVLDRGYFSKDNIDYLDECGYGFVMMLKGKADLMRKWILENKGTFESRRLNNIPAYRVYGKTLEKKLFATDRKPRYIHLYHSIALEANERAQVEKKIDRLAAFLNSQINKYREFGPGIEEYFILHYEDGKPQEGKAGDKKSWAAAAKKAGSTRKFVFFEERAAVIELELKLCGYFCIVTSEKMTAKEALELYKGRDASEKLFMSDKTFLGNHCLRVGEDEAAAAKIFIEFVALIIRNRIYTCLKDEMKKLEKKPNYMSVPAALRELDKIEMIRGLDGVYRLDHAVTATQKTILKAFGLNEGYITNMTKEIATRLEAGM